VFKEKERMLSSLKEKGFSENIIKAFEKVERESFVPEHLSAYAYEDTALPLEDGSTISQPYTVAFMLNLLDLHYGQKILEIGSGSGYVLALISEIIKNGKIYGLEINKNLAIKSKIKLARDSNVNIINRSGFLGLADYAPYDRILISASCSDMRIPYNLAEQLSENGLMVVPVKQSLFVLTKKNNKIEQKEFFGFNFVPFKEN
jgi:protein-L-isoaspartate(D-aspartate) O-methyltransferase